VSPLFGPGTSRPPEGCHRHLGLVDPGLKALSFRPFLSKRASACPGESRSRRQTDACRIQPGGGGLQDLDPDSPMRVESPVCHRLGNVIPLATAGSYYGGHPWQGYGGGGSSILALSVPLLMLAAIARISHRRHRPSTRGRLNSQRVSQSLARHFAPVAPVLASDMEREETSRQISHAVGEGRLTLDEGGDRIDAAFSARHRHELDRLVSDLPPAVRTSHVQPWRARLLPSTLLAVVLTATALLVQAAFGIWVLWPIAVLAFAGVALRVRRTPITR
jgi:hypothetical protein